MPIVINKILLSLGVILLFTLFIGIHTADIAYPNHNIQSNGESVRYMAKRRFLPTRRELDEYISGENEEDASHLNVKRYFLKSKRYFLNSKRDDE